MQLPLKPWWMTDSYSLAGDDDGPDLNDTTLWGPKGAALVPLYDDGRTAPGWGLTEKRKDGTEGPGFMKRYLILDFSPRKTMYGYKKGFYFYAWIMRSTRKVAIDIDGKNGGFEHASKLGWLPRTTAETSKSGNGYHLFYLVDDEWDPATGFGRYHDAIGIVQGVDIRGTGCIYHYPTQRWNGAPLVQLPPHLSDMLLQRTASRERQKVEIQKTLELEPEEIAIMHDALLDELKKPIKEGKRNSSLFAIGSQLYQAGVPGWQEKVHDRAVALGLDSTEADKLVLNIENYGDK